MRKDSTTSKLTEYEKDRNKKISKVRYIVEQYFGLSHLNDGAKRARFTDIAKNKFDVWYRQAAFNISKGLKIFMCLLCMVLSRTLEVHNDNYYNGKIFL